MMLLFLLDEEMHSSFKNESNRYVYNVMIALNK